MISSYVGENKLFEVLLAWLLQVLLLLLMLPKPDGGSALLYTNTIDSVINVTMVTLLIF